ncbi:MAG: hypothetical protein KJZ81_08035 [Burkholderiaceae bacterium]|jgi:sRNA-binding protein|nr:hypothetical protein [Burkholderiaceae bacterium]
MNHERLDTATPAPPSCAAAADPEVSASAGDGPVATASAWVATPAGPPPLAAGSGSEAAAEADDGGRGGAKPPPAQSVAHWPEVLARLETLYPSLFSSGTPKPLKLRIQADIQQRAPGAFTRKALSMFLHRYTTRNVYLKALVAAETRFDLDGAPAGEIAPEHREAAVAELARRRAMVQARRQAAGPGAGRGRRPDAAEKPQGASPTDPGADRPREAGPDPGPGAERRAPARPPGLRPDRPAARPTTGEAGNDRRGRSDRHPRRPPIGHGSVKRIDTRPPPIASRPAATPADPAWPADDAQRERALLLRAWESSPLAKPNFCALKRLSEADFDAQIAQARAERDARR